MGLCGCLDQKQCIVYNQLFKILFFVKQYSFPVTTSPMCYMGVQHRRYENAQNAYGVCQ